MVNVGKHTIPIKSSGSRNPPWVLHLPQAAMAFATYLDSASNDQSCLAVMEEWTPKNWTFPTPRLAAVGVATRLTRWGEATPSLLFEYSSGRSGLCQRNFRCIFSLVPSFLFRWNSFESVSKICDLFASNRWFTDSPRWTSEVGCKHQRRRHGRFKWLKTG